MGPHGMSGQPPAGYHPDYPGYQPAPGGHYAPHQPPVSAAGGFRLHGAAAGRDGPQEPRELRAGQSPRMYGDYQLGRADEPPDGPRVPTVRRAERNRRRSPSPSVLHAPLPAPPIDDMAPQSVSFIGDQGEADAESTPVRPPRRADRAERVPDRGAGQERAEKESSPASGGRTYRVPRAAQTERREMSASPASGRGTFKVRRTPSPQRERSPAAASPAWATRRGGSESPARQPAKEEDKEEEEAAPEVLAAMKVNKIKKDADPDMGEWRREVGRSGWRTWDACQRTAF